MMSMDKTLAWMFRCCGISPSGTHIDKCFSIAASSLIIIFPLKRIVSDHVVNCSTEGCFLNVVQFLSALGTIGLIVNNLMEPEKYLNIVKDLDTIGNEVQSSDDTSAVNITSLVIVTLTLIQLAIVYEISFYFEVFLFVAFAVVNAPSLQQMVVVERIKSKFSALNDLVLGIASNTSSASTELDYVFQLHSSLQALAVDVDLHFCFFNLLNFVSKFIFCVFEMYRYLASIENVNERLDFTLLISFLRQVVFFIGQAQVCHACSQEANRTVLLAHRVLQPDTPLELWEKVGQFSALAVDNKVYFTVGGIFTLDRGLITQTAQTALSYLIIAIQLKGIQLF